MSKLVKKIAYLSPSLDFVKANKEFLTYFESPTLRCEHFLDFVIESERKFFIEAVESNPEPSKIFHFKLKRNTGEYKNNVVNISFEGEGENYTIVITTFDIEELLKFNFENSVEEQRIRRALSITDEYFFYYDDNNGNFKIFHYHQNTKITDVNQNIDEWKEDLIKNNLIDEEYIPQLDVFVHDLKSITASSAINIRCAVRSHSPEVMESLKFIGVAVCDDSENAAKYVDNFGVKYGSFVVGRILTEEAVNQAKKSTSLISELQLDSLTSIYNKKTITEYAKRRIASNKNEKVALIIIDLDHFKPVNDIYGHLSGDAVLAKAANIFKEITGDDGYVGRFGGDEFMLVVDGLNSEPILRGFLRSIQSSIKLAFDKMFEGIHITCSIGCAIHPKDGETYEELFKKADFCLYRAKNKGRDRYVFYRDDLHRAEYENVSATKSEGGKVEVRDILELKYMADFTRTIHMNPKGAVEVLLNHMLCDYKLDNVTIFYGKDLKPVYSYGSKLSSATDGKFILSEDFKNILEFNSFVKTDFSTDLAESPYKNFITANKIKSAICCLLGTPDDVKGVITFNRTKFQQMFANYEFDCITMFAAVLNLSNQNILRELIAE